MTTQKEYLISATDFKQHFQQYINEINTNNSSIVITKRDKPIAKILPIEKSNNELPTCFGLMKGCTKINEDIVNFSTSEDWEANNE